MPCILFRSTSILSARTESETPLSRSPSALDLPFLDVPKHVRFPCPFASPDLFASEHQTYSQAEYDRTPIEPPSEEERACSLPARGARCFDADEDVGEEEGEVDEDTEEAEDYEHAVASDEEGDEHAGDQIVRSSSRSMFRCWTLDGQDDDDEEEEVEEEGETSDDQRAASPPGLPRQSSTPKRHPSTPGPTRRPSSSCSPTTTRRLQWLQTQTESLPSALRDRLLLLASSTSPPPRTAPLESPSSPMSLASLCSSPPASNFSVFAFAPTPADPEAVDDDAEERTLHSSTPRPTSSFPVSFLITDTRLPSPPTTVSDESEYFPSPTSFPISATAASPPPRSLHRLRLEREDSECSSAGSRTTDEVEGFFYSPDCSSASSASDWGMEDHSGTADTSLVASDYGGATPEWEGLGKELGQLAGGFRVSRWTLAADGDGRRD